MPPAYLTRMKKILLLPITVALYATSLPASAETAPESFPVGGLHFQRPTDWAWIPVQSSMRKAQLLVPGMDPTKAADVTFFHFGPTGGGDLDSNIQRWFKQFQGSAGVEKVETKDLGGRKVTIVSTEGTFSAGMPGGNAGPLTDYALLGAILEDPQGNVFVKMTGPKVTVQNAKGKFLEFLTAAKP